MPSILFEPVTLGQHKLPHRAVLVDAGVTRATFGEHFGRITTENLKRAHALIAARPRARSCWMGSDATQYAAAPLKSSHGRRLSVSCHDSQRCSI